MAESVTYCNWKRHHSQDPLPHVDEVSHSDFIFREALNSQPLRFQMRNATSCGPNDETNSDGLGGHSFQSMDGNGLEVGSQEAWEIYKALPELPTTTVT